MKILLIIGHNPVSTGAYNKALSVSEFDFWYAYVQSQVSEWEYHSGHSFRIVTRPYYGRHQYRKEMRHVHDFGRDWGADLSVEFHFNGAMQVVKGHEVLHFRGSKNGIRFANICDNAFDTKLPNRDRGVKPRGVTDSGGYGLYIGRYPSILVEPFFNKQLPDYIEGGKYHDNLNDAFKMFFKDLE